MNFAQLLKSVCTVATHDDVMTSNAFRMDLYVGNHQLLGVTVDSPHKGPIIKKCHGVFVVDSIKPLNKEFRSRWNETPWLMWRRYYVIDLYGANRRTTQTEAVIG